MLNLSRTSFAYFSGDGVVAEPEVTGHREENDEDEASRRPRQRPGWMQDYVT